MKLQDLTLQQLKEIVGDAPEGAEYYEDDTGRYLKEKDIRSDYSQDTTTLLVVWCSNGWTDATLSYSELRLSTLIKLSDIRTRINELEPVFKVGDRVVKKENNAMGEYAKSIISYNPETGIFTFLVDAPVNKSLRGQEANSYFFKSKYKRIQLKKRTYLQHRLAWYFYYGVWPKGDIDHINGVRDDNRIANLRDVSKAINTQNQRKARSTNPTGFIGVRKRNRKLNPYNAQIKVNGRNIDLGVYKTPEEAHAAYLDAKRKYHEGCTL